MSLALKLALAPLLVAQALQARRRLPRLPEADGPRCGEVGSEVGSGPALSLLILGDSSAAGVGVATQDEALAGRLAGALARRMHARVRWQLRARSGINTTQALALLRESPIGPVDVAVLVTGVNDVVDRIAPRHAVAARAALVEVLRRDAGVQHIVLTPVPPMQRFAGLPQPLRWMAGRDAAVHDRAMARWASSQDAVAHLPFDMHLNAKVLAADGFHPGAQVYAVWGAVLAEHIAAALRQSD